MRRYLLFRQNPSKSTLICPTLWHHCRSCKGKHFGEIVIIRRSMFQDRWDDFVSLAPEKRWETGLGHLFCPLSGLISKRNMNIQGRWVGSYMCINLVFTSHVPRPTLLSSQSGNQTRCLLTQGPQHQHQHTWKQTIVPPNANFLGFFTYPCH